MQLAYNAHPGAAFAGMIADTGFKDVISRVCGAKQLEQVTVTTEYSSEIFTVTINGNAYAYTSDTNATKTEIADGLKALIDLGDENVTVTNTDNANTSAVMLIENNSYDTAFTISVTDPADGVLTLVELIPFGKAVPFGAVVVDDERADADSNTGKGSCRLPRVAADITSRGYTLGVAIADTSKSTMSGETGGYKAGESVPVLRKGRIWMHVEDIATVAKGGLVYVRTVTNASYGLGSIRAGDDGGNTDVLSYEAAHFTGQKVSSLGLAVVEWNNP